MKFSQLGQLALASAVSAALVVSITACGQSNTVDFIYVASASGNPGNIYAFAADGESGALTQVLGSPFPTGRNPIALLTSPDGGLLYALNHDDNTVTEYIPGSDGKLYGQKTFNIASGTNPNGMALSPDGATLYVVEAYGLAANGTPYSPTTPGVGALVQFHIDTTAGSATFGNLQNETSYPTCNNPVAVAVLGSTVSSTGSTTQADPGSVIYVVNDPAGQLTTLIDTVAAENRNATGSDTVTYPVSGACSGGTSAVGQITSYVVNQSNNALTAGTGSPYAAGVAPVAIASDPTNRFVYVTDFKQNLILSYGVQGGNGLIVPLTTPTVATGLLPSAITVDPRGQFIFVANYGLNTVGAYQLNGTTGVPTASAGGGSGSTQGNGPSAVIMENSIGRYVYTANFIDGSVTGLYFNPSSQAIQQVQNSPFTGVARATAVASVKHGDHAIQLNPSY